MLSPTQKAGLVLGLGGLLGTGLWLGLPSSQPATLRAQLEAVDAQGSTTLSGDQASAPLSAGERARRAQSKPRGEGSALPPHSSKEAGENAGLSPELIAEGQFMVELRELWVRDPLAALTQVEEAKQRFGKGPGAAERGWIAARSLTALGRHAEAQEEAQRLVAQHPKSHWANDAERHLLVHPLGLPSREQVQRDLQR